MAEPRSLDELWEALRLAVAAAEPPFPVTPLVVTAGGRSRTTTWAELRRAVATPRAVARAGRGGIGWQSADGSFRLAWEVDEDGGVRLG